MSNQHPIVPSPEQVDQWFDDAVRLNSTPKYYIARQAALWSADQQLEECCEQLKSIPSPLGIPFGEMASNALRNACRPDPPSLKEQALEALEHILHHSSTELGAETIRKALEALPND
jgi:hypothetical protein